MSYCLNILTRSHKFGVERKRTVPRKGAGGGGAAPGRKEREIGKTKVIEETVGCHNKGTQIHEQRHFPFV